MSVKPFTMTPVCEVCQRRGWRGWLGHISYDPTADNSPDRFQWVWVHQSRRLTRQVDYDGFQPRWSSPNTVAHSRTQGTYKLKVRCDQGHMLSPWSHDVRARVVAAIDKRMTKVVIPEQ